MNRIIATAFQFKTMTIWWHWSWVQSHKQCQCFNLKSTTFVSWVKKPKC